MSLLLTDQMIPSLAPGFRLQWEEVQQAYVLLYPEGMIKLNASAGEILKRCDGHQPIHAMIIDLRRQFLNADIAVDVLTFLEEAYVKGWIRNKNQP